MINKISTRILLSGFIKKLFWGVKYLAICISNLSSPNVYYYLLQKQFQETNSNFFLINIILLIARLIIKLIAIK